MGEHTQSNTDLHMTTTTTRTHKHTTTHKHAAPLASYRGGGGQALSSSPHPRSPCHTTSCIPSTPRPRRHVLSPAKHCSTQRCCAHRRPGQRGSQAHGGAAPRGAWRAGCPGQPRRGGPHSSQVGARRRCGRLARRLLDGGGGGRRLGQRHLFFHHFDVLTLGCAPSRQQQGTPQRTHAHTQPNGTAAVSRWADGSGGRQGSPHRGGVGASQHSHPSAHRLHPPLRFLRRLSWPSRTEKNMGPSSASHSPSTAVVHWGKHTHTVRTQHSAVKRQQRCCVHVDNARGWCTHSLRQVMAATKQRAHAQAHDQRPAPPPPPAFPSCAP